MSSISIRGKRFIISAIVQGAIITGFAILIVAIQMLLSPSINVIQFLSLSFEGPAKWFFLGFKSVEIFLKAALYNIFNRMT